MQPSAKVEELLEVLKSRGMNEGAVENVKEALWTQASDQFMQQLVTSLTEDDLKQIEGVTTQEEANAAMRKVFQEKTGRDLDEEMRMVVDQQASELIEKYQMPEEDTPVISSSTDSEEPKLIEANETDGQPAGDTVSVEKSDDEKVHDLT